MAQAPRLARASMICRTRARRPTRQRAREKSIAVRAYVAAGSPRDGALLRRVYVLLATRLEEKRLHVLREEAARLWIHQVQTVVVDEHHLLPGPLAPAVLTDLT